MQVNVKAPIKRRDGFVISEGRAAARWDGSYVVVTGDAAGFAQTVDVKIKAESAHKYLSGFKPCPSLKTLEKQSSDGVCTSLRGKRVEPDGIDPDGFPSWLLALGYV